MSKTSACTSAAQHPRYAAQVAFTRIALVTIGVLAALLATARAAGAQGGRPALALVPIQDEAPAKLIVDAPVPGALAVGAVIIQYRTENLRIVPVFGKGAVGVSPRVGHLHLTVDALPWHWVDATGEPVTLIGLTPGAHEVTFELADATHRVLAANTVKFTVPAPSAAAAAH
jgi:hypothetical protein